MGRTAAALAKQERLPEDVAAEGLDPESLSPLRFSQPAAISRRESS